MKAAENVYFTVNGYRLAGLRWRQGQAVSVLALHGWLDNAASFIPLAPQLQNADIVALDLAGHGHSDHKPAQATYNLWDDLQDIMAIADQLGWQRFALLGHSRGAMMASLFAAAMPERVSDLFLLDGLVPEPISEQAVVAQLRQHLIKRRRGEQRARRSYSNLAQAVEARQRVSDISTPAAELLLQRSLLQGDDHYQWRTDPRLRQPSALKLTQGQIEAVLAAINCPVHFLVAEQGLMPERLLQHVLAEQPAISVYRLPGQHHFHMEQSAVAVADIINCHLAG